MLERHPQLLLLSDLRAASAAAAEALASLSPRAAAAPAETAAAARAAVATAPYLILRLAAEPAADDAAGCPAATSGDPPPLPLCWEDLPMEVHNLMASEWDEWDDYDEKRAAYNKEWAGR